MRIVKKINLKAIVAGVVALLMVVTAFPVSSLGGTLTAQAADTGETLKVKARLDYQGSVRIEAWSYIPGSSSEWQPDVHGYKYELYKDGVKIQDGAPVHDNDIFSNAYVETVDGLTNEYSYDLSYSDYNSVDYLFVNKGNEEGQVSSLPGTYEVRLLKNGVVLKSQSIVVDELIITGNGQTLDCTFGYDESFDDYYINLDVLKKKGCVIQNFTDASGKTFELGDYNDKAMLKALKDSTNVKSGTTFNLTANYIQNEAEHQLLEASVWHDSGVVTGRIMENGYKNHAYMIDFSGPLNTLDEHYYVFTTDGMGDWGTYDSETNVFVLNLLKDYISINGEYSVVLTCATEMKYLRTAAIDLPALHHTFTVASPLNQPTNPKWKSEGGKYYATWDAVENASGYYIVVESKNSNIKHTFTTDANTTKVDVTNAIADIDKGYYRFQVRAVTNDVSQHGNGRFCNPSDVLGLSDAAITAKTDINDKVTGDVTAVAEMTNEQAPTVDQKAAVNAAVNGIKTTYSTDADKQTLATAVQSDTATQNNIATLSKAYAKANNITVSDPLVDQNLPMKAGNISADGVALSASEGDTVQLQVSAPTNEQKNLNGMSAYSSVVAFQMDLKKGTGEPTNEVTNLDVPVTIKLPVPDNMNPLSLCILHYLNGDNKTPDKIYPTFTTAEDGTLLAVFTITHFSTFAFADNGVEDVKATKPTISGTTPVSGSTKVTITADSGDTIYYTTDGTTPTTSSKEYTGAFTINKTTTIKAIAVNANKTTSDVATKEFTIESSGGSSSGSGTSSGGSSSSGGGSSSGGSSGGGGGSSDKPVDPTPAPTPDPTPAPTPGKQDASEYTNSTTGEVILDKIVVPETDEVGTKITKKADGTVVVSDAQLGSSGNVSPAVFAEGQVYRLYNPNTGEHFYTKNPQERDSLANIGWNYEADQTSKTIASTEEGAKPVYRVYNPNSGLHHYTTNKDEAVMLKGIGWNYEGISMYAYDNNSNKGTVTYRVYCPFPDANGQNQHIYTTSAAEVAHLVSLGYQDEGTAWRVK